jgi:hypothetical protein
MNATESNLNAVNLQDTERVRRGEELLKELTIVQGRISLMNEPYLLEYQKLQAREMQLISMYNAL